jgi:hypothetical protein
MFISRGHQPDTQIATGEDGTPFVSFLWKQFRVGVSADGSPAIVPVADEGHHHVDPQGESPAGSRRN